MMPELLDSYGNVKIMEGEGDQMPYYISLTPELTEEEKHVIAEARNLIGDYKDVTTHLESIPTSRGKEEFLIHHGRALSGLRPHRAADEGRTA